MSQIDLNLNMVAVNRMLKSPHGTVGIFIHRLGREFVNEARRKAPQSKQGGGTLKNSIKITVWPGFAMSLEAGATVDYAMAVTKGLPARTIRPRNATVLKFPNKAGVMIYAPKSNPGPTKPNPYLQDALRTVVQLYA